MTDELIAAKRNLETAKSLAIHPTEMATAAALIVIAEELRKVRKELSSIAYLLQVMG
jgi:hypothetical protein